MPDPYQIVRCIKRDMDGDLVAGARYAEEIARNASLNAFSPPKDAHVYGEAARILRDEASQPKPNARLTNP